MLTFIFQRLAMTGPTILLVTAITFCLVRVIPGHPAQQLMLDVQSPAALEAINEQLGLNEPLAVQYLEWLGNLLALDFGRSFVNDQPVFNAIVDSVAVTGQVVFIAVAIATLLAAAGGLFAAWRRDGLADKLIMSLSIVSMSVPAFWIGITLIVVFGVKLQWLPTVGYVSPLDDFWRSLSFLVLPVMALVVAETGALLRMVRATALDVRDQDYVTWARSIGESERNVFVRYVLKNTMIPTITLIGLILGSLLGGAAVIETVFTLPGLGRLLITSIHARDYMMIQGIMVFISFAYIVLNVVVDTLYPLLDPRVRL